MSGRHAGSAGSAAGRAVPVDDLDLPVMLLHEDALEHNLRVMADWCREAGVALAPHAKTHMSRDLVRRQTAAGAWGFTAATPAQVRRLHGWGVPRVLHANTLVDASAIRWLAEHVLTGPDRAEHLCYVDSTAGVDLLERVLREQRPERPLRVLVELGFPGGRTGVRPGAPGPDQDAAALALARRVAASDVLALAGVAAFEGLMPTGDDPGEPVGAVDLLRRVRALVVAITDAGLVDGGVPVVTAGGSSYFDLVVREIGPAVWDRPVTTVLRSGCYVTHDHGVYRRTSPLGEERGTPGRPTFRPAFELRASVLSAPEDGRVILGFGRREVPTDDRMPVVLDREGWEVTGVNDHHAFVRVPAGETPAPGTVVRLGISHPCGAFDRWRHLPLVDPDGTVVGEITPDL